MYSTHLNSCALMSSTNFYALDLISVPEIEQGTDGTNTILPTNSQALTNIFHLTELNSTTGNISSQGHSEGSITITCSHGWASTKIKYFCRDPRKDSKDILVKSDQSPRRRYTLKDSGEGTFTVNITDLQESDSGIYWCGVERFGFDTFTKVKLTVSKGKTDDAESESRNQVCEHLNTTCPQKNTFFFFFKYKKNLLRSLLFKNLYSLLYFRMCDCKIYIQFPSQRGGEWSTGTSL
uniref:Immunoglobulin domain-containing protein n=1 Tax=Sinocyclocheilus anshuiensis TaxID=1608454 RepID=A0A671PEW9_9TELE